MKFFEPLVDGVVGGWYGDESKALTVARMSQFGKYDYVARYNGGNNAGGQVAMPDGTVFKFNLLPAGLIFGVPGIIGKGVLLNPQALYQEIEEKKGLGLSIDENNFVVSDRATAILPAHVYADQKKEQSPDRRGSTQKGISQGAAARYGRDALTMEMIAKDLSGVEKLVLEGIYRAIGGDGFNFDALKRAKQEASEWAEQTREMLGYLQNTDALVQSELAAGKRILAEGAQSLGLSLESRDYPLVTSSHAGPAGIPIGLGCNFKQLGEIMAVLKMTPTRVGEGEFTTEIQDPEIAKNVRGPRGELGSEYGTVTGRERRAGWPDLKKQNDLLVLHGISKVALTKLDCVPQYGKEVIVITDYDQDGQPIPEVHHTWCEDIDDIRDIDHLPLAAQQHIELYRERLEVDIESVGVGPYLDQVINL
ncbi:adenylosuccinate synthetase [Candidatus Saccharibacteria bacterium]|nr:adenylosuccinate synthetase [Candidatus Saccharibacteria bacterium]